MVMVALGIVDIGIDGEFVWTGGSIEFPAKPNFDSRKRKPKKALGLSLVFSFSQTSVGGW